MKTLNLIVGLSLGLTLTGCPGDDSSEEGGGTVDPDTGTGTTTNETPTTTGADETSTTDTPGTTTDEPGTTTDEPGTTTDEPGTTTDETGTTGEPALSFETDVFPIFMANCFGNPGGCHSTGTSGMLSMDDAATAYANLVDVPSANPANDQDRVVPGDAEASFLWHKVTGDLAGGEGDPMPLGAGMLPQGDLDTIEQWINDGAEA